MFVEYPDDHSSDCWIMFNPKTKNVHTTRDVVWLQKMYWKGSKEPNEVSVPIDVEDKENDNNDRSNIAGEGNNNPANNGSEAGEGGNNPADADADTDTDNDADKADTDRDDVRNPFAAIVEERNERELQECDPATSKDFKLVTRSGRSSKPPQ